MTTRELNRLKRGYQRLLRLMDWDISASFVAPAKMSSSDRLAEVNIAPHSRTAYISILDPRYYAHDVEVAVAHEMQHVLFGGFYPADLERLKRFEAGIDANAITIVAMRRLLVNVGERLRHAENRPARRKTK